MSLVYIEFLIPIILFIVCLIYFFSSFERKYFNWVKDHWFYKRSSASKTSSTFFYLGIFIMLLSVLDLRGPEEKIEAQVSKQETMILIDSSASMLAEDVRPNRFKKAIILAKHYVKKAVGQHISVTVFSDDQKKIIPYTNDVDLLEARLTGLETLDLTRGGTGLKIALQESVTALKAKDGSVRGNILVITDAENNSDFGVINIQEDINIAIVGIGTVKGGVIPLRDKKGNFKRNKKYNGKEVITKLDEDFLKKLSSKIKNFRYWTASSYSLPTEEILDFFKENEESERNKDSVRIKPVLANYLIIPAVILIILSYLFKNLKTFIIPLLFIISLPSHGKEADKLLNKPEKEKVKTSEILELEGKLKRGQITKIEKRKLANELLKEKFSAEASKLYKEIINTDINKENKEDYFNLGASELQNKNSRAGLSINKKLYDYLEKNDPESDLFKETKKNMLKAIVQQAKQEQKKKEQKEKKDKEKKEDKSNKDKQKGDKKEEKSSDEKKEGDKSEDQKDGSKGDKKDQKGGSGDQKEKKESGKDDENRDENKEDKEKDGTDSESNEKKPEENKDLDKKKDSNSKLSKGEKKKLPALLKQLMNDDNQLQRKVIDAATTKRGSAKKKDW